jgi:hypothetical protein
MDALFSASASASSDSKIVYFKSIPITTSASASASANSNISAEDAYNNALNLARQIAYETANYDLQVILQTLNIEYQISQDYTYTINYYNTKSLLINTPYGEKYGGVSAWQGIRDLGSNNEQGTNVYLIVGTTDPKPTSGYGIIFTGDITGINGQIYYLKVPIADFLGTSLYGPSYDGILGIYSFVGSYTLNNNDNQYGFIFNGHLNDASLNDPNNFRYPNVNNDYDITFLHSISNKLLVGNSGNVNVNNDVISYIYEIDDVSKIKTQIKIPGFPENIITTYGIWDNGNNVFTIVGGATDILETTINKIYDFNLGNPIPYDCGFIMDYYLDTNTFENYTPIKYKNSLTHFQGISKSENGTYSLNADVVSSDRTVQGYFLTVERDVSGNFIFNEQNWIALNYFPNSLGKTSSNSVVNNKVVGLFISNDQTVRPNVSYQLEILKQPAV